MLQKYLQVLNFVCIFFSISSSAYSQLNIGIKGGLTSFDFTAEDIFVDNSLGSNFRLAYEEAHYGFYGAVFLHADLGTILIQPEIGLSSVSVDYSISELGSNTLSNISNETYTNLDVPLIVGLDLGVLQLKGGAVGHLHLSSSSELLEIETYRQNFDQLSWGWQGGIGIKLWKFLLDIRYEKNNDDFGNHFEFNGQPYSFDKKTTRYIATLGFLF